MTLCIESPELHRRLLRLATLRTNNSADAEDVLQSALLRALERAAVQSGDTDWPAWLIVVVRRLTIDLARRSQRWGFAPGYDPNQLAACSPEPAADWMAISAEELAYAVAELEACHPSYRQAYELYYERRLSYKQIAKTLKIPVCTVATRLHRVRKQLRSSLERARASHDAPCGD